MKHFRGAMREQGLLMPHDLSDWLPEDHLARFVIEIVDQLDFSNVYRQYKSGGSAAYDPKLLVGLLFYGYSTGIYSSRKLESSTYDSVAFRFISGNQHPDHDTISHFRKRFLVEIQDWFKQILLIGKEMNLLKMGEIYIDGSKIQANASRHKAMSYTYMERIEKQLEEEIKQLLDLADKQDALEDKQQLAIPEELKRREDRIKKIREAKKAIQERAKERYKQEMEAYEQLLAERKQKEEKTGKKLGGNQPIPPEPGARGSDQYSFTDPESRIMKTPRCFDQCYNAQAAVNQDMLIVGAYSNNHGNDKKEFIPAVNSVSKKLGVITSAIADSGYYSDTNVLKIQEQDIEPIIATSGEKHNSFLANYLSEPEQIKAAGTVIERMRQRLRSPGGSTLYKKRKQIVEPVFGIIKEVLGFRRFLLRGEQHTNNEWSLVCIGYNLKRLFKLKMTPKIALVSS